MIKTVFQDVVSRWFTDCVGEPSEVQQRTWPLVRSGRNVLVAAPTGSGKTLAAFLHAIEKLGALGEDLRDETHVLYVSPLKALGNDVQKNLVAPLNELRIRHPEMADVRVLVRSGDTPASTRQAMRKRPPHILVTTPESLYILLSSESGRGMLATVRTVIVDEIHAVLGDKRGSHLSLSLERLEALTGGVQRIGLSATQKPVKDVASFLVGRESDGSDRPCEVIDVGHKRVLDIAVEVPPSPLEAVCSHETWSEVYERICELVQEHRTTLVFVNTRKLAERTSAQLAKILGTENVTCHHSSLSKDRRLDAEVRLKNGELKALVATASLELGIDVGDVDLVVQVGSTSSIATFLQRVGRAGHSPGRIPRGRLFPLTIDELCEAGALMRAVTAGTLDRTPQPGAPLDILAQQIVAECTGDTWSEDELFSTFRRAYPYRDLSREDFDAVVALHTQGRHSLLHRDGVAGRLRATKRARITVVTSGGAIPDNAQYRVTLQPEDTHIGFVDEDFAIESSAGDIFQLGTSSWRILKVEPGTMRVADARGAPPTLPFWVGEAPARTRELSAEISAVRELPATADALEELAILPRGGAEQLAEYHQAALTALGALPTTRRVVLERFFDETGGMQLVLHSPFGGRINRAWGLSLRKRFCRGFGFELQAAATEDAIVLSLGLQQSFPLAEVYDYLHPNSVRDLLIQALLDSPMFETRWRWNAGRALLVERSRGGKRVPVPIQRMRSADLLAQAFPEVAACGETLPGGDLPVPDDHPLVTQTIEDCLHEAMDLDGLIEVLQGLRDGSIEKVALDLPEPSPLARAILSARPYAFLDDAPLEERRTQAVQSRRILDLRTADELGVLDHAAVERVRDEAWPTPVDAEEVHEALLWMGYVTNRESASWSLWLAELAAAGRIQREGERIFATEVTLDPEARTPLALLRGRLDALGLVFEEELRAENPAVFDGGTLAALESQGHILRVRLEGREAWCERRLLARIHRYTVERLRKEIEPVSEAMMERALLAWQHEAVGHRLEGPNGVSTALRQLAAFEAPAATWEKDILPSRVQGYRREWLDHLTLSGELAWGRLWGSGACGVRIAPITFVPREELAAWVSLARPLQSDALGGAAAEIHRALEDGGAMFPQELQRRTGLLNAQLEAGLGELITLGAITCDGFAALRQMLVPPSRRRRRVQSVGRWSVLRNVAVPDSEPSASPARSSSAVRPEDTEELELVVNTLFRRYGVLYRKQILRERIPVPWRDVARKCRQLELRGEIRGGRFVAGPSGEQFALPEAVTHLRRVRKEAAADQEK